MDRTEHLLGLLLGTEEDWPRAFEELVRRLGPVRAGGTEHVLHTGDAFYEPANVPVPHFDALDGPATFVAFYLLDASDTELIRLLS